ncbi:MAG: SgcJ/EcaC family oxidoreductase [Planctomycetes bacterium]|jgi:uncharacterized protein (TIGR02246 family)|nr:SgcJ/EcaC family oxidoreductase [Planctomycetota bacterium]
MRKNKLFEKIAKENFTAWENALHTKNAGAVAEFYSPRSTFLPTVSPDFKKGRKGARDYFEHFLAKNPIGKIVKQAVQVLGPKIYLHSGMYNFYLGISGRRMLTAARFSFVWKMGRTGKWQIIHHHSSVKP